MFFLWAVFESLIETRQLIVFHHLVLKEALNVLIDFVLDIVQVPVLVQATNSWLANSVSSIQATNTSWQVILWQKLRT